MQPQTTTGPSVPALCLTTGNSPYLVILAVCDVHVKYKHKPSETAWQDSDPSREVPNKIKHFIEQIFQEHCFFSPPIMGRSSFSVKSRTVPIQMDDSLPAAVTVDENFHVCLRLMCSSCVFSYQALCLEIEQIQQASDSAELERWSKLSSSARDELATLKCILGSMKDNQVASCRRGKFLIKPRD